MKITKERVKDILEFAAGRIISPITDDEIRELARIALASLEAEPVAWLYSASFERGHVEGELTDAPGCDMPVYTSPPAPVSVPDLTSLDNLAGEMLNHAMNCERRVAVAYTHCAHRLAEEVRDLRSAMLQGADSELQCKAEIHDALCQKYNVESLTDFVVWQRNHIAELEAAPPAPVGPGETAVMPDYPGYTMTQRECFQAGEERAAQKAWVACSERMPDPESKFRVCAYTPTPHEDVRFRFVPASLFKSVCRDATHWQYMLPPAAPQQEVK